MTDLYKYTSVFVFVFVFLSSIHMQVKFTQLIFLMWRLNYISLIIKGTGTGFESTGKLFLFPSVLPFAFLKFYLFPLLISDISWVVFLLHCENPVSLEPSIYPRRRSGRKGEGRTKKEINMNQVTIYVKHYFFPPEKEHKDQMSHTSKNNLADRDVNGWMSILMRR